MPGWDVAVVGAGIAGAAVAWGCARRGARVVVVDRGSPACGASGAAAGMLAPCSEAPEPGPFADLCRWSLGLWPALAAELLEEGGADCELDTGGLLRVALGEAEVAPLRSRAEAQSAAGVAVEWLEPAAVAADEPGLGDVAGAALYAGEGHVHSVRAVNALLSAARRRGAEVVSGVEVTGLDGGGALRLDDGRVLTAGDVVVCAGAWSDAVASCLGGPPLPVEPVRGQILGVRGVRPGLRRVVYAGAEGYAVAKRDGLTLVGATEERAGFDARPTEAADRGLRETGTRLLRGFAGATVAHTWVGLRPRAPDGLPLLGRIGDGLFAATGHHRNGVLLAPATAGVMATAVLDGLAPAGWEAFDPLRVPR
ncbi:MAG TPA: glycine oxidase ThiO [Candidatus Dormibacteraeota bacterium]|jgi:glycine oxidase|nr:glycine oxidase ThiO [Candidatus Dormibacteraeota bacterium]